MNKFQKAVNKETNRIWRQKFNSVYTKYVTNVDHEDRTVRIPDMEEFIDECAKFSLRKIKQEVKSTLRKEGI